MHTPGIYIRTTARDFRNSEYFNIGSDSYIQCPRRWYSHGRKSITGTSIIFKKMNQQ